MHPREPAEPLRALKRRTLQVEQPSFLAANQNPPQAQSRSYQAISHVSMSVSLEVRLNEEIIHNNRAYISSEDSLWELVRTAARGHDVTADTWFLSEAPFVNREKIWVGFIVDDVQFASRDFHEVFFSPGARAPDRIVVNLLDPDWALFDQTVGRFIRQCCPPVIYPLLRRLGGRVIRLGRLVAKAEVCLAEGILTFQQDNLPCLRGVFGANASHVLSWLLIAAVIAIGGKLLLSVPILSSIKNGWSLLRGAQPAAAVTSSAVQGELSVTTLQSLAFL